MDTLVTPACRFTADTELTYVNTLFSTTCDPDSPPHVGSRLLDLVPEAFHPDIAALNALTPQCPSASIRFPIGDPEAAFSPRVWDCVADFTSEGAVRGITAIARPASGNLTYRTAVERLLRTANDPSLDDSARIRAILACSRDYFGMDTADVVRLSAGGTHAELDTFEIDGETATVSRPRHERTLDILVAEGPSLAISDIRQTAHADRVTDIASPPLSLLASEILVDGQRYGAVLFTGTGPRVTPFSDQQLQFRTHVAQWLGFVIEQHRALADLKISERKYRHLFEYAPAIISILDASERITDANNSWLSILGYDREAVIGRRVADFFASPSTDGTPPDLRSSVHNVPVDLIARNGQIVQSRLSTLDRSAEGSEKFAVMVDVTERNRVLLELTNIRKSLTKANEELKRFNAIAAHDLQEPLRKIRLFGGILRSALKGASDPEIETAIEKIIDAANRLTTLVKDLLLYSRESERSYARQKVNLSPLLDEVINDLALSISETGARIRIFEMPEIEGDPVPLQRLFTNLLLNALKYRREDVVPEIDVFSRRGSAGTLELVVRDNGIGFNPGEEQRIFTPFVRVQPARSSGSGIGLAICKSIVTGHGWSIHAENREVGGADLVIALDHDGAATPSESPPSRDQTPGGGRQARST